MEGGVERSRGKARGASGLVCQRVLNLYPAWPPREDQYLGGPSLSHALQPQRSQVERLTHAPQ